MTFAAQSESIMDDEGYILAKDTLGEKKSLDFEILEFFSSWLVDDLAMHYSMHITIER